MLPVVKKRLFISKTKNQTHPLNNLKKADEILILLVETTYGSLPYY